MPNTFQNVQSVGHWLTMEGLRLLTNKLVVGQFFNTDYSSEFSKQFAVGDTISVPLPQQYTVRQDTLTYSADSLDRQKTSITLDKIRGVDFEWDAMERALEMERGDEKIREEYLDPAMATLAQEIDSACAQFAYQNASLITGVLGTDPTTTSATSGAARRKLVEYAATPGGERGMIVTPAIGQAIAAAQATVFNPASEIARMYKEGTMGRNGGFDWSESMSIYQHTAGVWAGAVTVKGAGQSGSTLLVNATNGDTFKKGDKITIAGVYPINPMTKRRIGSGTAATDTRVFTVLADVTAASSEASLSIYPAITTSGHYQNVSAGPANTAALTLFPGTSSPSGKVGSVNLALTKEAFALVGVPLEMPKKAEVASQMRDPKTGLHISFIRDFDITTRKMKNRFDVAFGFGRLHAASSAVAVLGA